MHVDERIELVGELVRAAYILGQTYGGPTPAGYLLRLEKAARAAAQVGMADDGDVDRTTRRLEDVVRDLLALMVPDTRVGDDTRRVMGALDE